MKSLALTPENLLRHLPHHVPGVFVVPQPGEDRVSHEAFPGPPGEGHFADQLRLYPGDRGVGPGLNLEGAGVLDQGLEFLPDIIEAIFPEAPPEWPMNTSSSPA